MSEKTRTLLYALWIAHPVLQTAIAAVMFRRGQYRAFKYFFAYVVAQILTFAVVFPTYWFNHAAYFYVSSFTLAISVALGFMVIHEAFLDVLRPFHTLRDLGTVLFKWAGLVMLLVAGVVTISTKSSDTAPWVEAILTAQRCLRIVQIGMVLFLLIFARYLGVSRRQHSFGIALGFGTFAVVELGLISSWASYHLSEVSMGLVNMVAYNGALVMWLGYMLTKSPARDAASTLLRPQRWEQSLSDIQHPLAPDSLIPMFEGMVDRALSRTPVVSPSARDSGVPTTISAAPIASLGLSARAGSKD